MSLIDKTRARRSFERAAADYDSVAVLQREIADRMLERLDYVRLEPARILDLGTGTGYAVDRLQRRYRRARVLALDFAHGMLLQARRRGHWMRRPACICADAERLPLADASVDLIVSNATFQWCNDLLGTFGECLRILRPGGLFMFTTFGPDTLRELRDAWSQVDAHSHVSPFLDMHDIGDTLTEARFTDTVMDAERLTLTYARVHDLMRDLKVLGAHNATEQRPRALTGRARIAALADAYELHRSAGRLPASYEVIYGHAWAPLQRPVSGGVAIALSAIGGRKQAR
ncbi:malonyl-ACP O-methyltransferase BioC [Thiocystis violacea]|uniref:malonyl-ACP O-methyltransferase BioC n=1 Tax=Thiocystis violacea TaxID=13725 RepID=UPI001902DC1C|nr:malonyl-ACP O-methyltransferase BioC [Thiocystis violacea]MBK1723722.1 malonyl-[acyl-carrier protein] O-methyltransferase BioC [Thiocystis violacea]